MNHAQRIRELRDDADVFDNDARRLRHGLARHYLRSAERKREEADRMEGVTTLRVPILSMPCNVPAILLDDVQRMQSEPLPIQQLDLGL